MKNFLQNEIATNEYHPERAFAVFSDVRANLPALRAVLADIKRKGIWERYCLGNVVDFSPWPNEVIDLIRQEGIAVVGGSDDINVNEPLYPFAECSPEEQEARRAAILWRNAALSDENKLWLQSLAFSIRIIVGGANILMSHARPMIHSGLPADELVKLQAAFSFDVFISGHAARADIRYVKNNGGPAFIIANTGVVGQIEPDQPQASWLLCHYIKGRLELKTYSVNYDVAGTAQSIKESDVPDYYAEQLIRNGMSCTFDLLHL